MEPGQGVVEGQVSDSRFFFVCLRNVAEYGDVMADATIVFLNRNHGHPQNVDFAILVAVHDFSGPAPVADQVGPHLAEEIR